MDKNSTPFISYCSINIKDVDLIEDAWGLSFEFCDVFKYLRQLKVSPGKMLTNKLIEKIRQQD